MTLRRFSSPKKLRGLIGYLFPYSSILNKKEQAWLALSSFQKRARKHGKYFRRPIERQIEGFAGNRSFTLFAAVLPARPATLIYVRRLSSARKIFHPWFYFSFGAKDSTIFSKRGSPRSGSQKGCSFKTP